MGNKFTDYNLKIISWNIKENIILLKEKYHEAFETKPEDLGTLYYITL